MSLKSYTDAPLIYDDTELSATDINTYRANAIILNSLAQRNPPTHIIHRKVTKWEVAKDNDGSIWKGGFMYRTGNTTARFVFTCIRVGGNHKVKILFNDVLVYDAAINTGTINIDISINNKGYYDEQIISVNAIMYITSPTDALMDTTAYFSDAYVFPIWHSGFGAFPGTPTITASVVDQTKLNQLGNAQDWLARRLALVPYVGSMGLLYFQGTNRSNTIQPFYYCSILVTDNGSRLRGTIYIVSRNPQTYIRVTVNNVDTEFGPYSVEQSAGISLDIDLISLGCAANTSYVVTISERCVIGNNLSYNSRVNVGNIRTEDSSLVVNTTTYDMRMRDEYTYTAVQNNLNTIAGLTQNTYNILAALPTIFDRAKMFRGKLGVKPDQDEYWLTNFIGRHIRVGDKLWVKGKGLSLAYGPIKVTREAEKDMWTYEFEYNHTLTSGDAVESKYFYLDQFEGLYPGMGYFISGKQIDYVAEFLL